MKISWNWLEQWIDLGGIEVDELGHRLTMAGLEVESIERIGAGHDDIVVGRITSIDEHPGADRLVICTVDVGDGTDRQIACGAENMEAGDAVPVALPGSRPPALDFEVAERELMGKLSEGMLCSAEELGLAHESDGLMILPEGLVLGGPVFDAIGMRDAVYDLDLTPNRSDCLSHLGVAREVSALFDRPLSQSRWADRPPIWEATGAETSALEAARLRVADREGCPRYAFGVLEDVRVGSSPLWLKKRLWSVGMRSVNNIVDVTNFVLMDVGQPLHAFDLDRVDGSTIVVRRARRGEELPAIDGETYELASDDLVIADRSEPIALAGVIGGEETEVTESTDRVLLECAFFQPETVRRSSKRHDLHTESSHRFERRIDPSGVEPFLDRALRTLERVPTHVDSGEPATVLKDRMVDSADDDVGEPWIVGLDADRPAELLGVEIEPTEIEDAFDRLGIDWDRAGDSAYRATIPPHRGDLRREADLTEEIGRLYGYDELPETLPEGEMGFRHRRRPGAERGETLSSRPERRRRRAIRQRLLDLGLFEVVNHSFMSAGALDLLRIPEDDPRRDAAEVANPIRAEERYLRTTLLPSLIDNLVHNRSQKRRDVALFEVGRRYFASRVPDERQTVGLLLAGRASEHWSGDRDWDFFDLKGIVESVLRGAELESGRWREPATERPWLHPGVQAVLAEGDETIVEAGRLHPEIVGELELEGPVLVGEIDLDGLLDRPEAVARHEPFSSQPPIERDVALVVDRDTAFSAVREAIEDYRDHDRDFDRLVEAIELFDVYEGDQVPDDCRSLAFSVTYRAEDRTLEDDDVRPLDDGLVDWLQSKLGVERRG
ncbi:MAG: phenylalanine--tRNA ligase subunit beta [Bradymonadaceae bacterium]